MARLQQQIVGCACDDRAVEGRDGLVVEDGAERSGCEHIALHLQDLLLIDRNEADLLLQLLQRHSPEWCLR